MSKLRNHSGLLTWASAALTLSLLGCDSGKGGTQTNGTCTQGDTRSCKGPGACDGAQICQADKTWSACDCGSSGTGGSSAGGSTSTATSSSSSDVGGSSSATGGATAATTGGASSEATSIGGAAATGGATSATGGATSAATGGVASTATGGASLTPTGGATSAVTGGATSVATGGAANVGGKTSNGGSSSSPYLVSDSGWIIDAAHNLEGPLFTFKDPGGSIIDPDCDTGTCFAAAGTTSSFCVTGTVAQALDADGYDCEMNADYCDWTTYWGAAMAINPNQGPTATDPSAWDASGYTGISFKTAIDAMPPNLRIYLSLVDGTQFCYTISTSKTYTLTWSQFRTDCYTTGGTSPTTADLKQVESIAWQAGTNASAAGAFDFCISDVKITP